MNRDLEADLDRVRLDKWLWAARFFKTRALAQAAITAGRVRLHGERVKPAREIAVGDQLALRIGEYEWLVTVRGLAERRGPAATAAGLYRETGESHARRLAQVAARKAQGGVPGERTGRPTKRERRQIIRFRDGGY